MSRRPALHDAFVVRPTHLEDGAARETYKQARTRIDAARAEQRRKFYRSTKHAK